MPTDPTTYVGAAIGLLGLAGGGVAWFIRRRDAKADPIPKQAAAVALAEKSVSMMQTVAVRVDTELAAVRVELMASRARDP
jgi:MYXO-CTERM domain-containing protein